MYKIITHHITEEHFDHPMAAEVKKSVDTKKSVTPVATGKTTPVKTVKSKDYYIIDDQPSIGLDVFEKENIYAWSQLANRLNDLVISVSSNSLDTADLTTQLTTDIAVLGKLLEPIATADQVAQFESALASWATALIAVVGDTVKGTDPTADTVTLMSIIETIATFLNSLESSWDATAVTNIFTDVSNLYIAQAKARQSKDWPGSQLAANNAYKILVVAQPDGTASLADVFVSGIYDGCK